LGVEHQHDRSETFDIDVELHGRKHVLECVVHKSLVEVDVTEVVLGDEVFKIL